MPYRSTSELGKGKEGLPAHAKSIYMAAFNSAYKEYGEERAHAIAWSAVKKKYKKEGDKWVAKSADEAASVELIDHMETMLLDLNDASNLTVTKDGFMVAVPRIARTGIQLYKGSEMGIDDAEAIVRVYRPEGEVFDWDAVRSLAYKPVTLDHPPEMVDARNWRKYAVGQMGGEFARDGQFIRFPMTIMDAAAVTAVKAGQAQLSVGYTSAIFWEDGTTPDGEPYDAIQKSIRANHVAVVGMARGGDKLKIGDEFPEADLYDREFSGEKRKELAGKGQAMEGGGFPIENEQDLRNAIRAIGRAKNRNATIAHIKKRASALGLSKLVPKDWGDSIVQRTERSSKMPDNLRTIVIDGVSVEVPEISAQVVQRAIQDRDDENKQLRQQVDQRESAANVTLQDQRKLIDEKDGQIAALKRQLADLEMTPAKLDKMVRDRLEIVDKARTIMGDGYICDGRTDVEIKRAVVSAKIGEQAARSMSDEAVGGAFMTLTSSQQQNGSSNLARALGDGVKRQVHSAADAAQIAYDERSKRMANAWRRNNDEKVA